MGIGRATPGDPWYEALVHLGSATGLDGGSRRRSRRVRAGRWRGFRRRGPLGPVTMPQRPGRARRLRGDWQALGALMGGALGARRGTRGAPLDIAELLREPAAASLRAGDDAARAACGRAVRARPRAGSAGDARQGAPAGLGDIARLRGDLAAARNAGGSRRSPSAPGRTGSSAATCASDHRADALGLARRGEKATPRPPRDWHSGPRTRLPGHRPDGTCRYTLPSAVVAVAGLALLEGDPRQAACGCSAPPYGPAQLAVDLAGHPDRRRASARALGD